MKKRFNMVDLDCANCAAKMEAAIKKIDGVNDAAVSFLAQKLVLDADDARFDDILKQAIAAIKKVDGNVEVIVK
jgi:copper chaperone CopZ